MLCATSDSLGHPQLLGSPPFASPQLFLQQSAPCLSSTHFYTVLPETNAQSLWCLPVLLTCTWRKHHTTG